jgi:hypothetical protein
MFGDGKKEGYGEYFHKIDKFRFKGEFKDNEPRGNGRIIF